MFRGWFAKIIVFEGVSFAMNDKTTKMSLANKNSWLVSLLDFFLLRYCSLALHDILGGWNDMRGKVLINKNVFEYVTAHWNHRNS